MKICAIICEYNPFHNGHMYQIAEAKRLSGADAIVCIMGEHFTQRGEAAILPPSVRAKHAILGGADAVISLPAVFATSPAEIFARGAVAILSAIPDFSCLSFGAEHADADFFTAADILNNEHTYAEKLKANLAEGYSFALAREKALQGTSIAPLLSSPNDILAIEYARALLPYKNRVHLLPIERIGAYKDKSINTGFSSATAIRAAIQNKKGNCLQGCVPPFVLPDLTGGFFDDASLVTAEKITLLRTPADVLKSTLDCSEGLENALLKEAANSGDLVKNLTSRRYTAARIRRICLQNLLDIRADFIKKCLAEPLYIKPLAVKKGREDVLSALSKAVLPCIIRYADEKKLQGIAKECYAKEQLAKKIYCTISSRYEKNEQLFY